MNSFMPFIKTKVEECGITLLDGTFILGSGHVVTAANNGEFEGGNMRLHCHGELPEETE